MRLHQFRVHGFKCIHDSGSIAVGDIAALVGKNESGKTTLLEALTHLNKDSQIEELDLCDELHEHLTDGTTIVEGLFTLSPGEIALTRKQFPSIPALERVEISRQYKRPALTYDLFLPEMPDAFEFVEESKSAFLVALANVKAEIDGVCGFR
jgi:energy-coupling factor transporter ATP-binding protein EcfA2